MARKLRRWVLRVVLGLLGLVVVLVVLLLVVLANLDMGFVKGIVRGQAHKQGLDVDYDSAGVTLGRIHLTNVRVASPPADAKLAPNLAQIGSIEGRWSPFSKRIDELVIRDVTLNVVQDDDGKTSIDRLVAQMPPSKEPPPPATPLSQLLANSIPGGLAAHVRVENISVHVIPSGKAQKIDLTGLGARADLEGGRLVLHIGPADLRLGVDAKEALAKLDGTVELDAAGKADITLGLELVKQDVAPEVPPVKQVIQLKASASFDPKAKTTHVHVEPLALVDGALQVQLDADLLDGVPVGAVTPIVRSASCRIDAVALARAVPKAYGPIVVEGDPITCSAKDVELIPAIKGQLNVAGNLTHVAYQDIDVRGVKLDVAARPDGAVVHIPIDKVTMPGLAVAGADVKLSADLKGGTFPIAFDTELTAADVATPTARVRGARVKAHGTAHSATNIDAKAAIDVDKVDGPAAIAGTHLDLDATGVGDGLKGRVKVDGKIASLVHPSARASGVVFALDATLPSAAKLRLDVERLDAAQLPPGPAHVEVDAPRIVLEPAGGDANLLVTFAGGTVSGKVSGNAQQLGWDLDAKADRVGPARAIALHSKGSYGAKIEQDTTVDVGRVATASASLRGAHLHITSSGTLRKIEAQIAAALDGVVVNGASAGSPKLEVTTSADLDAPKVDVKLKGQGPDVDLHLAAAVDRARTVTWSIDGHVAGLKPLAALLPAGPDWARAKIEVRGHGSASGVVRSVAGGVPVLVADPMASARGKQQLHVGLKELHYAGAAETSADVDGLTLDAAADLGETQHAVVDLAIPSLAAVASGVHVTIEDLALHADALRPRRGDGKVKVELKAKSIKQSAFASYPVRDLDLTVDVVGAPDAAMAIDAHLANPGAGTSFEAHGELDQRAAPAADAVPGRHSVAVDGKIEQVLDKLDGAPEMLRAGGRVTIPFRVESGDLALFHTTARIDLQDVDVQLPASKLSVRGARGSIPIVEEIVLGPTGSGLVGHGSIGPYPEHRYLDQQPFLGNIDYLSVAEVTVGSRKMGPVAGNARIDRDVIALDQLELNALGGKITGQFQALLRDLDTSITFRGKVTGVKPSSGDERLDANAAVTLRPYRLGLEGRIEIVRIGRDHLLDLLDIADPYHADVACNRVRLGLKVGYPKQVRLHFAQGFASFAVELGGLASAVRIDEIRGIPIGPALESWLAPVLEKP